MNPKLSAGISFVAGAAIGTLATWFFTKSYVQKQVNESLDIIRKTSASNDIVLPKPKDEEILEENSAEKAENEGEVPEVYVKNEPARLKNDLQKKAAIMAREKKDIVDYNKLIKEYMYTPDEKYDEDDEEYSDYPYLITKDMIPFGEKTDSDGYPYSKIALMYYDDGIIADADDNIIDDVEGTIGMDNLTHFGDYPDKNTIYVRNDPLKEDFEVSMSNLTWEGDILRLRPYLRQ